MTRHRTLRWAATVAVLVGAALSLRVVAWRPLPVPETAVADRFVRVSGVAHIHTTLSDGGSPIADIESAAAAAGLDFVIVTDHNSLAGKPLEGYGETGVLTIVGTEISNHEGHLLACFDLDRALREIERVGRGQKYVVVEAYRNEEEKANLLYWQLTCESFHRPEGWEWWFKQTGYTGDWSFIYFE